MKRPILRYFGGKWVLAPWIIDHFPDHQIYIEPFGGAASVLLRKKRSYAEIYNDLDGEVVNVFRAARDFGEELREKLILTPFSREEFDLSYEETRDPIERARRTIIRSFMGFGSDGVSKKYKTGFRSNSNRSGTTPAHDWKNYGDLFDLLIERLRGVVIENKNAIDVMQQHDSEKTLHYVDPPYVFETRSRPSHHGYRHEMTEEDHENLFRFLNGLKRFVVVSGYNSDLYNDLFSEWVKIEKAALADGAQKRTECLWISKNSLKQGVLL